MPLTLDLWLRSLDPTIQSIRLVQTLGVYTNKSLLILSRTHQWGCTRGHPILGRV